MEGDGLRARGSQADQSARGAGRNHWGLGLRRSASQPQSTNAAWMDDFVTVARYGDQVEAPT
jgi:hypothetical protein